MKEVKTEIRYVLNGDKEFWFSLDKHMAEFEFAKKVRDRQGYVLIADNQPVGILRYNLFWDNTPFCNLVYVKQEYQRKGYGKMLMQRWESEMQSQGYGFVLVSTRSDETSQHFYRKFGYKDCGCLNLPAEPEELFLIKYLTDNL